MRKTFLTAAVFALALSAGAAALAQTAPAGMPAAVKVEAGDLTDASGKALYIYDMDTMRGMSHCVAQCARAWPPLVAADDAKPSGDWTIVTREDGKKQWAYKNKPLYYYSKDSPGHPPIGGAQEYWKIAKP